jgi:L-seryl-tRNA(Ser) seleniumtransferase
MRGRNPDEPTGGRRAADVRRHHEHPKDPDKFGFAVWQLKDGEEKFIANRIFEILSAAPKA